MLTKGLLVRFKANRGEEKVVEHFLLSALPKIRQERGTDAWFGVKLSGPGEYGIVDFFPDEEARVAHLTGPVAHALADRAAELFEYVPRVHRLDVLAHKLPDRGLLNVDVKGVLLRFQPRQGRARDAEQFLRDAWALVQREPKTTAWFAVRDEDTGDYGIFDVFPDRAGQIRHLTGRVPRALARRSFKILGGAPRLELLDIVAEDIEARAIV